MNNIKEKVLFFKKLICSKLGIFKNRIIDGCLFLKKYVVVLLNRYKLLSMQIKIVIPVSILIILILIILAASSTHHSKANNYEANLVAEKLNSTDALKASVSPETGGLNDDLTDLQQKLANVEKMLSSRHSVINLDKVRSEINGLNQVVNQIESANKAQYNSLHSQIQDLSSQLESYQKLTASKLDEIESVNKKEKCLSASHLPFIVQSIDMVNGRDVISVLYDNMISPLENNFTLAGWRLKESDYQHQTARFVNRKGLCVNVNLNGEF